MTAQLRIRNLLIWGNITAAMTRHDIDGDIVTGSTVTTLLGFAHAIGR
jgi:hypothetical protein